MNRAQVLEQLAQSKATLVARYGGTDLALFGSTVRDTARVDSDIDILVSFDGPATSVRCSGVHFFWKISWAVQSTSSLTRRCGPNCAPPSRKRLFMSDPSQREWQTADPLNRLPTRTALKLATWNVNSLAVRLPQLLDWLALHQPDVLVLQETKLTDDKYPHAELAAAGWHSAWFGQKTYNGVALLARQVPSQVQKNIPGFDDAQARVIAGTVMGLRVVGAYFPNGQAPGSEKFAYKMAWLAALRGWLQAELQRHPRLVLMGDYNIAPEDQDVHDPVAWAGQIHCTDEERAHFRGLQGLGLTDAFRLFEQPPRLWSWWDYRNLAFRKNQGLRIDHILVSDALKPSVRSCSIDRPTRKNERPSDHAPVLVELQD